MSDSENTPTFSGKDGSLALFTYENRGVVIDTEVNLVVETGQSEDLLSSREWTNQDDSFSISLLELANGALIDLDLKITAAANRLYTIPKGAQAEAKKALEWRKEHKRGGTPVGLNTARTLARGGQIGLQKVRHIAKYFPRHEVDKQGKGWSPGQDNFPSNGRIAWALWGGDTAWRWAQAIVERENKAMKADGYIEPDLYSYLPKNKYDADVEDFTKSSYLDPISAPDFIARVRMDGSGIDRLYKIVETGDVYVWDDGQWDNLGNINGTIWDYDKQLDDDEDYTEKTHIAVDPDSAIIISARLQQNPYQCVSIADIDADEAMLAAEAYQEIDIELLDKTITAAGEDPIGSNVYTPEERAENAQRQVRDRGGKFAPQGASKDATNPVAERMKKEAPPLGDFSHPLDTAGILGRPRSPIDRPRALIRGDLPSMTGNDLHNLLYDWAGWVDSQRAAAGEPSLRGIQSSGEEKEETSSEAVYDHPLLRKWIKSVNEPKKTQSENESDSWAKPVVAATEPDKGYQMTPKTSDVKPIYLAVVAQDDPRAVLNLVAIVPESSVSPKPMTYVRKEGKWVRDPRVLNDFKSATPPPVVPLDKATLNDVLLQVDESSEPVAASASFDLDHVLTVLWGPSAVTSAGGLDRNRGKAEELRRYWTVGKGGLKIRWGTGGDWTRCVRQLEKYLGPRAKGYCALRHKEMTGMWTGDKKHRQLYGRKRGGKNVFSTEILESTDNILVKAQVLAKAEEARRRVSLTAASGIITEGLKFKIPLVIPEDLESGDGRKFKKGALSIRELPLPLMWQIKTAEGHMGSVVVGRIDRMERTPMGIGNAYGVFDTSPHGREVQRLIENGFIKGVSADLDQFEAKEIKNEAAEGDDDLGKSKLSINKARVMAVTIVPKPAFQECKIIIEKTTNTPQEDSMIADGVYQDDSDYANTQALIACGIIAGAIPVVPPTEWFNNPGLDKATPITVDDNGRVFGHIAAWNVDHIGLAYGTKPPRSKSNYAYFHTGVVRTESGKDVPVGQLTLAGGHASLEASAAEAVKHYDDTASAIADVHAGEDAYGIWVAGALRPSASPEQIRALRASAPSGDWRPIRGSLELVAVCQVNVPGFPIARARVASGAVMALVAAGALPLAKMKLDPTAELAARIERLENLRFVELSANSSESKLEDYSAQIAELSARVRDGELTYISREVREGLAKEGKALPDGSFPIRNVEDLRAAIHAYGRAKESHKADVKKHIIKMAGKLNVRHLVPENWKTNSVTASADDLRARIAAKTADSNLEEPVVASADDLSQKVLAIKERLGKALAADGSVPEEAPAPVMEDNVPIPSEGDKEIIGNPEEEGFKFTPGINQPRDYAGRFQDVLGRLKLDLGTSGLQNVVDEISNVEKIYKTGSYAEAADAAQGLIGLLDRIDSNSLTGPSLENVRAASRELGEVLGNLPLPFGDENTKLRFSDLPPALKNLMTNMVDRVGKELGEKESRDATADIREFMRGGDLFSQADISSVMSRMLRLLT
jgi:hypothetical protein